MDFILIWFGGFYAVFLVMMAVESATDEKPWAAFATGAAIGGPASAFSAG